MAFNSSQLQGISQRLKSQGWSDDQIQAGFAQFSQNMKAKQAQLSWPSNAMNSGPSSSSFSGPSSSSFSGPSQTTSKVEPTPKESGGIVSNFFKSLFQPITNTAKYVGEASRVIDPTTDLGRGMIKSAVGADLSPKEQEAVAGYQPRYFSDEQLNRWELAKGGAKTVTGLAAYAVPAGTAIKGKAAMGAISGAMDAYARDENILTGAAFGAGAGVALGAGGNALAKAGATGNRVIDKILNPFASQYDDEIVKIAAKRGVDLPVSATTSSNAVKQIEAIAQKSLWGGKVTKTIIKARDQVDNLSREVTEELTGELDNKSVGNIIKNSFSKFRSSFIKTKTGLYNKIPKKINDLPASVENTKKLLQNISDNRGASLVKNESEFFSQIGSQLDGDLSLSNIKQTRTDIIKKLGNFNDPVATGNKSELRALVSSLSDDIEDTIKKVDPDSYKLLEEANRFYRNGLEKINSKIGNKIKNADPEKLLDDLIKPNSETNIALVKSVLDDKGVKELQDGFVTKIYNQSVNSKTGFIDVKMLKNKLDKYGTASIKELIGADKFDDFTRTVADLEEIDKLASAIKRGAKPAEGSQTAYLVNAMLYAGGFAISPQAAVGAITGGAATSKIVTSDIGRKWLTEGMGAFGESFKDMIATKAGQSRIIAGFKKMAEKAGATFTIDTEQALERIITISAERLGNKLKLGAVSTDNNQATNDDTLSVSDQPAESGGQPSTTDGTPTTGQPTTTNNQTAPAQPQPFGGRSKGELLQLALAQGASFSDLKEVSDIYDMITAESGGGVGEAGIDDLLKQRAQLQSAGFSTDDIDRQITSMGYQRVSNGRSWDDLTEKDRLFANAGATAQRALDILKSGDVKTGIGQGIIGRTGEKLGTNSLEQQTYRSRIALARTALKNALLGASMSDSEMESISAFIPEYNDAPSVAMKKLEIFVSEMNAYAGLTQ